ncbi:MAG: hypothetical protein IBJ03_18710 [Gemmatimonadaceae bacterium]|nr:hypothetical protein [Gemmatimonadaceae bacterium]
MRHSLRSAAVSMFVLFAAAACYGSFEPTRKSEAQLGITVSAQPSTQLRTSTSAAPASVEVVVGHMRGGTPPLLELARTVVPPDSGGRRVTLTFDLSSCLETGANTCALYVRVRLRDAAGVVFDSSQVGPLVAQAGVFLEAPTVRFRGTARLVAVDTLLRLGVGQSAPARVQALDSAGQVLAGRTLTWRTRDAAVATVTADGVVTAVGPGATQVDATRDNLTASVRVVVPVIETFTFTSPVTRTTTRQVVTTTTVLRVAQGRSTRVRYRTSNAAIATVDTVGRITTISEGGVVISAIADADTTDQRTIALTVESFRAAVELRRVITGSREPIPGHVYGVTGTQTDSMFAAVCTDAQSGRVSRLAGTAWQQVGGTIPDCVRSVALVPGAGLFSSGSTVRRFNGTDWVSDNAPTSLFTLAAVGPRLVAVGANGAAGIRENGSWRSIPSVTSLLLDHVAGSADGTILAASSIGQLWRLVNDRWTTVTGFNIGSIFTIAVVSANEMYVAGSDPTSGVMVVRRFDGSLWRTQSLQGGYALRSIVAAGTLRMAVNSVGQTLRLVGEQWVLDQAVVASDPRMAMAANGDAVIGALSGTTHMRRNGVWTRLSHVPSYHAIWAANPRFILGGGTEGSVDFFDGTSWRTIRGPNGPADVTGIWGPDSTLAYIAIGTSLFRWQGGRLDSLGVYTANSISAIWGVSATRFWLTTLRGEVVQVENGVPSIVASVSQGLSSISGIRAGTGTASRAVAIYASGGGGSVLRFDGLRWFSENVGSQDYLVSVFAADSAVAWVATYDGAPPRVRGVNGQWTSSNGPSSAYWVAGTGPRDVYAGSAVATSHFDGTRWATLPQPVPDAGVPISYLNGTNAFALPTGGLLLGRMLRTLYVGVPASGEVIGTPR